MATLRQSKTSSQASPEAMTRLRRAAIRKISDPAAKSFAEWKRLRASAADFNEIMAFRKAHPLFPEPAQDTGIEKALFLSNATAAEVLKFYTNRNPMTGPGKASLGAALMETGNASAASGSSSLPGAATTWTRSCRSDLFHAMARSWIPTISAIENY